MKNGTVIPQKNIDKLLEMHSTLQGTSDYGKLTMCATMKNDKGSWFYVGWYVPDGYRKSVYKKFKGTEYIYQGDIRFEITDAVKKVLQLEGGEN